MAVALTGLDSRMVDERHVHSHSLKTLEREYINSDFQNDLITISAYHQRLFPATAHRA